MRVRGISLEAVAWVFGLLVLALSDPHSGTHMSLCPFKAIGISWCPGCGMGHSISFLFRGDLAGSLRAHPLGIPAVVLLIARVVSLVRFWIVTSRIELEGARFIGGHGSGRDM